MILLCFVAGGIQFATAQLPLLELVDCGMTICDLYEEDLASEEDTSTDLQKPSNSKLHLMYQKLIIKHGRLKKLSLWGCSGLDVSFFNGNMKHVGEVIMSCVNSKMCNNFMQALYLNCPELNDLNLNLCKNLHPGMDMTFV